MLIEFLPLILFLGAYFLADIYVALIVLMVAMPVGLLLKYVRTKTWDKMYLWSTVFLIVMGTATLWFRNPEFLYWKPTAFYWALAVAFLISGFVGEKTLAQRFFDLTGELPTDKLSQREWRGVNLSWVSFFIVSGLLNIWVAYRFDEAVWVNFKVFGLMAVTFVFLLAQGAWLMTKFKAEDLQTDDD
ncbi:MAG: inner membrane-spanning protein YciB [Pseudomonadota bacterium]